MAQPAQQSGPSADDDPVQTGTPARPSFFEQAVFADSAPGEPEQKKHKPEDQGDASSSTSNNKELLEVMKQMNSNQQTFMTGIAAVLQQLASQNAQSHQAFADLHRAGTHAPAPAASATPGVDLQEIARATSEAVLAVQATTAQLATSATIQESDREERKRKAEKLSKDELQAASKLIKPVKDRLQKVVNLTQKVDREQALQTENDSFYNIKTTRRNSKS